MWETDRMVEDFQRKEELEILRRKEDERLRVLRAWNDSGSSLPGFFDSIWSRSQGGR